ncbi:PREDICTED: pygopus homolog 1 [Haliaeetus leucocephalus]|uniref:pygopus homolog 1 n=1 Tax=Haliaeetus leucocephalus TaxID=52644 RepID=UPI00053CC7BA|nr:PREDICTED: pygopus homolog 1 [Haliaeetus leucocephalus]
MDDVFVSDIDLPSLLTCFLDKRTNTLEYKGQLSAMLCRLSGPQQGGKQGSRERKDFTCGFGNRSGLRYVKHPLYYNRCESLFGLQEPAEMVFQQCCKMVQVPQGFSGAMAQASLEVDQNSSSSDKRPVDWEEPELRAGGEKNALSTCRTRGGDSGLDGLGGPGVQLGSPDKKKRKANTQGSSFPPPSEYAPPLNPSSDHLVAANPFDDNYNTVSYKPLPSGNPYFSNPGYPGFGGYNTFRMPPHMLPRVSSPYGGSYSLRNQPHPLPQNPVGMGFSRPHSFSFGPHDNPGFGNQPPYSSGQINQNVNMPGQHFRPNPGENFGHSGQIPHPDMPSNFGPGNNPNFPNSQLESNHSFVPPPNTYNQTKSSAQKQDFSQSASKASSQNTAAHQHHHRTEDIVSQGNSDLKNVTRNNVVNQDNSHSNNADNTNAGHSNGTQSKSRQPRGTAEGCNSEKSSKTPLHPSRHGHSSSEPVYPCGICTHEVNDDQDAILCEASCQKWFHRICTGMTESAYGLLTAEASAVWGCDTCMADKDVQLMRTRETAGPPTLNTDG